MKLKSLILGSVAAAGLSTAGYAADLGVLTSLDVCDSLGISGLTISSSDNCLQITGGVSYEFAWGDYRTEGVVAQTFDGSRNVSIAEAGPDWSSKVEAWLKFVGTAPSDFGPASVTVKLKETDQTRIQGTNGGNVLSAGDDSGLQIDEAYVQVGDTTTIMAGKKGSIANLSDDEPFNNFLGLFSSDAIDGKGVGVDGDTTYLGGHVIQVVSEVADGVKVGAALENLNGSSTLTDITATSADAPLTHGSAVGVVSYAGEGLTAHITGAALGILDGQVESWFVHAGATGTFDAFKIRGAVSYWDNFKFYENTNAADAASRFMTGGANVLNALISAEGSFDLFKISASAEVANIDRNTQSDYTDWGVGGQVGVNVTEGVSINLGARYFNTGRPRAVGADTTQVAAQVVAALTETIKATGEVGAYFGSAIANNNYSAANTTGYKNDQVVYGAAELAWAPGGGFTSSLRGEANTENAYKVTFKAAKEFK